VKQKQKEKGIEKGKLVSCFWQIFKRLALGLRVELTFSLPVYMSISVYLFVCLSVRVTAWQKATGYEFFITFSHCNQNEIERGEGETETDRGHYVYVTFV